MPTITCDSTEGLTAVAKQLLQTHADKRVFALHAEMGTGKTTFVQAVCTVLGSADHATSPTFAIVNEYPLPQGGRIFHLDCYRLENLREAEEIGVEEYLYSGDYCFVEWPENIGGLIPENCVHVYIRTENPYAGGKRVFTF